MPITLKRNKKRSGRVKKPKRSSSIENEIGFIGKALRGLGGLGGSSLGAMVGQPSAGASLGTSFGAALSRWLGSGDYSVSSNSMVTRASSGIPSMHKNNQSVVIRHKEFIGQISGSTGFTVQYELPINPGLQTTFPWLSNVASRFQEYKIRGMVYHYVPTSGSYSASGTALGSVMMQTTYRASDTAPLSKVEILNEYWSNEVVPSETMAHPIECDPRENPFSVHYVRTGIVPGSEIMLHDVGKTFVATSGMGTTGVVGDLWVTYEVELKKPIITSDATEAAQTFRANWLTNAPIGDVSIFVNLSAEDGNLPVTFAGRVMTIPRGYYGIFSIYLRFVAVSAFTATSTSMTMAGAPTVTNCTPSVSPSATAFQINPSASVTCGTVSYCCSVLKSDPSTIATVTFPLVTGGTGNILATVAEVYSSIP